MAGQLGGIPILILGAGSERVQGRDAQTANINAAKAVAEAIRTTLGPKGMDKMLVNALGDVVITNDGVTILKEMEIESPAAKMIVEVAKTVDSVAGDGTTTSVVIAGELLKKAEDLLEQQLHPSVVNRGYRLAAEKAREVLNEIASDIDVDNEEDLKKIARTSITGKFAEASREFLSEIAMKAVKGIAETGHDGHKVVDIDNIDVVKKVGGRIEDTELVQGIVIDKEVLHSGMPTKVEDAKIALISTSLEVKKTEMSAELKITTSDQLKGFLDEEEREMREMVEHINDSGANVVICQKGVDETVQHYLAKYGILAVRRSKKSDMERLSKATGGNIVTTLEELSESDLGHAGLVDERKMGGGKILFVEKCKNPHAVSIILRGGTEQVVDEVERALHDMLMVVASIIEDGKAVAGGAAVEMELTLRIREYGASLKGREQLAVEKFAEALEIIPRTLAENAGLDPIDKLVELKAAHERGDKTAGLNVYTGKIVDMWQAGVIEPLRTKKQSVESATEAAMMILRIDDVIASTRASPPPEGMPPGGMPGGMPPGGMMPY